nr:hypothetical protein Iba_chr02dCG16880 [Ipomoea batatas]
MIHCSLRFPNQAHRLCYIVLHLCNSLVKRMQCRSQNIGSLQSVGKYFNRDIIGSNCVLQPPDRTLSFADRSTCNF